MYVVYHRERKLMFLSNLLFLVLLFAPFFALINCSQQKLKLLYDLPLLFSNLILPIPHGTDRKKRCHKVNSSDSNPRSLKRRVKHNFVLGCMDTLRFCMASRVCVWKWSKQSRILPSQHEHDPLILTHKITETCQMVALPLPHSLQLDRWDSV